MAAGSKAISSTPRKRGSRGSVPATRPWIPAFACMTTCPSGVHYMHLVDHGRRHIEAHYRRPWSERLLRRWIGRVLTRPGLMRWALHGARVARPFAALLPKPLRPLVALAPRHIP